MPTNHVIQTMSMMRKCIQVSSELYLAFLLFGNYFCLKIHKKECRTGFEIQGAMKAVKETQWGDSTPFIDPPCDLMTISANIERTKTHPKYASTVMILKFHFVIDNYQEIVNVRDFGVEAFWSSVGWLLGMFLGYSCLQLAEITMDRIYSARNSLFLK